MSKGHKRNKRHRALFDGQEFKLNRTDWAALLEITESHLGTLLRKYNSMQSVIDNKFTGLSRQRHLVKDFLFGGHNGSNSMEKRIGTIRESWNKSRSVS